jgi:CBS domain-containing protein
MEEIMITVRTLIRFKGNEVWSVTPQTATIDALLIMKEKDVGALLVLEDKKIAGIISERDFVSLVAERGGCDLTKPVQDFMTKDVFTVNPDQTIEECMQLMINKDIRHIPVLENGELIGLISIKDVINAIISEKEILITNLENYIEGRGYIR